MLRGMVFVVWVAIRVANYIAFFTAPPHIKEFTSYKTIRQNFSDSIFSPGGLYVRICFSHYG